MQIWKDQESNDIIRRQFLLHFFGANLNQIFDVVFDGSHEQIFCPHSSLAAARVDETQKSFERSGCYIFNFDFICPFLLPVGLEHGGEDGTPGGQNGSVGRNFHIFDFEGEIGEFFVL